MRAASHVLTLLAALFAGDVAAEERAIPFAPLVDRSLADPDNPAKTFRLDFAEVEAAYPLSRADAATLTPAMLAELSQEEIDQIYARLTAGAMPEGYYASELFFAREGNLHERLEEIVGIVPGRAAAASLEGLLGLADAVWKGKVFFPDEGIARTPVQDIAPLRLLVDDPDTLASATVPREGPLRLILPADAVWLLFPAKVYCGQSLIDGRRESIVVDYNYADEIDGFRARPDALLARGGLALRDEMRMVRPGFYLGRAYVGRMFLMNFTLVNRRVLERDADAFASGAAIAEACWPGEQARRSGEYR
jgi:hypothetical protein